MKRVVEDLDTDVHMSNSYPSVHLRSSKKQRLSYDSSSLGSSVSRKPSILESMPTEILQKIFLESCNGSLLVAAPRVAMKLSGSNAIRVSAFLLAFYTHQLKGIANVTGIGNLVPAIGRPLSAWDARSMAKTVLGSRWCTFGWVQDFLVSMFRLVAGDSFAVLQDEGSFIGEPRLERLSLEVYAAKALEFQEASWDPTSVAPLSAVHFNLSLQLLQLDEEDSLSMVEDEPWDERWISWYYDKSYRAIKNTVFREFQWRLCGCVTMQDLAFDRYEISTPFRDMVSDLLRKKAFNNGRREDFSTLGNNITDILHYSSNKADCDGSPLWEILAIDYFFSPEDEVFRIPASLYRAAAVGDLLLEHSDVRHHYALHFLFEIDPTSLPKTDELIVAWAKKAESRQNPWPIFRDKSRFRGSGRRGRPSLLPHGSELRDNAHTEYVWVMDRLILQYLYGPQVFCGLRPHFDCSHLNASILDVIENEVTLKALKYQWQVIPQPHEGAVISSMMQNMPPNWEIPDGYCRAPTTQHEFRLLDIVFDLERVDNPYTSCLDLAVTPGGPHEEERRRILEDDNAAPGICFETPKWRE